MKIMTKLLEIKHMYDEDINANHTHIQYTV
jgi:hypothetical protein